MEFFKSVVGVMGIFKGKVVFLIAIACIMVLFAHSIFAKHGFANSARMNESLIELEKKQDILDKKIRKKKKFIQLMKSEDKDLIQERVIKVLKYIPKEYVTILIK